MLIEVFRGIIEGRFKKCKDLVFGEKRDKYSSEEGDVLWSFKSGAAMAESPLLKYGYDLFTKQLVWLLKVAKGEYELKERDIDELFNDLHNYLFLLEAIIWEKRRKDEEEQLSLFK